MAHVLQVGKLLSAEEMSTGSGKGACTLMRWARTVQSM